jgi:hypothetical protein
MLCGHHPPGFCINVNMREAVLKKLIEFIDDLRECGKFCKFS